MKRTTFTTLVIYTIIALENSRCTESRKLISSTIKASSTTESPAASTNIFDRKKLDSTTNEPYKM